MPYKPIVNVELNGARFKAWNSITIKQMLNTLSSVEIDLPNPAGLRTTLAVEDMPIKVYLGWDTDTPPLRFDGYHDDPSWSVSKGNVAMGLTGRDFGRILFDEHTVDDDYVPYGNPLGQGYILAYLEYMADNLSSPIDKLFERNNDEDDRNFIYSFVDEKAIEVLKRLIQYGGYEWLMALDQDDNRQWIIRPPKQLVAEDVTHAFIVGEVSRYTDLPAQADVHHVETINVKKQYGFKKNYVKVIGDGVSAVYPVSPPSSPKHLTIEDDSIQDDDDAFAVARRIWTERSSPKTLVDFGGVGVETLRVGDVVYVNDYRYGASELPSNIFRLVEINDTITFGGGWKASFKVADFAPTLFQFFGGTEGL